VNASSKLRTALRIVDGVSGRMYHYPERDLDLVVLGNVSACTGDLCWEFHDRIVSHCEI